MAKDWNKELLEARWMLHLATSQVTYIIYLFGNELAEEKGYDVTGLEAVALYLLERSGVPPERTLLYKADLLGLLLSKEMKGWNEAAARKKAGSNDPTLRLIEANAGLDYSAECFGDVLAEREGYGDTTGEDALRLYLINKHHWHPADVAALSITAMRETLAAEMDGWVMSAEQSAAIRS